MSEVKSTVHVSVMPNEVLRYINPQPGQVVVDGTLGGAGHAKMIAARLAPGGCLIGLDRDPIPLQRAEETLKGLPVVLAQSNFCDLPEVLEQIDGVDKVDAILLDLGLSSDQLADRSRGFSFNSDGSLDLRFDVEHGEPAWKLLGRLSQQTLADLIYQYGEERFSRRIAQKIVETRRSNPIKTAAQLAELVRSCVPVDRNHAIDPATRTFQALRIAVNDELKSLEIALKRFPDVLKPGGVLAIISFHSLEDRRVKEAFRNDSRYEVLTPKALTASPEEIEVNPRSRSAKFRVAKRI
ncbi:MAG: 16S rRNA (cytosine(1402)-N(4))-methyltransferase RsmH [Thermoguttaceae bacterium]|nr:16S rRNA (cytosine(1402)-N(4))-methyltransferase RsmH [Thermoguttaceae bacterium]